MGPSGNPKNDAAASPASKLRLAQAAIETLAQPVIVCDGAGRLAVVSAGARELWDLPEDLRSTDCACVDVPFADQHPGADGHPLDLVLAGEDRLIQTRRLRRADGELRPAEVRAVALRAPGGQLLGATMSISDVEPPAASDEQLRNYASDIQTLSEVSRLLSELQDPDEAAELICTVATGATGAIVVLLWKLLDGELTISHAEGALDGEALERVLDAARTGAGQAQLESQTVVEHFPAGWIAEEVLGTPTGPDDEQWEATVWHEPLITGNQLTGVLSIVWMGLLDELERPGSLIGPLAHHAATGIERAELLRRLGDAASSDPLTGVANRRTWEEAFDRELARAAREELSVSLVLIDIDHFKAYNDRFGHPEGDRLLRDAATAWSHALRGADLLARIGGEEFAVLLPGCGTDNVLAVAERLRAGMPHGQTCSLGAVTWDGTTTSSELYSRADEALYRAKHGGRNRVGLADPPGPAHALRAAQAAPPE